MVIDHHFKTAELLGRAVLVWAFAKQVLFRELGEAEVISVRQWAERGQALTGLLKFVEKD